MRHIHQLFCFLIVVFLLGSSSLPAYGLAVEVRSDADMVQELGLLQGDGQGLRPTYLAKSASRLQAAIVSLRLLGLESEALSFTGKSNYDDAGVVSVSNQRIIAYLKANPSLGWVGSGNNTFDPLSTISAKQLYKAFLAILGYQEGVEYTYSNVLTFARTVGLTQVAAWDGLNNRQLAAAIVEMLNLPAKGTAIKQMDRLIQAKVIDGTKVQPILYPRVSLLADDSVGKYLVDASGKALYTRQNDGWLQSRCAGACLADWPLFHANPLQIPSELDASDFDEITREDGAKQTTYKGMPLYSFVRDFQAGDAKGEGVESFESTAVTVKAPITVRLQSSPIIGSYITDASGLALYVNDQDPEGSSVCTADCLATWPLFYSDYIVAGEGLLAEDFAVITRDDGLEQSTYKGIPLYYYRKDVLGGEAAGQGLDHNWFIIEPKTFHGTSASKGLVSPTAP